MAVPEERFEEVAAIVNAFPEVAHNYEREHALNMWFVLGDRAAGADRGRRGADRGRDRAAVLNLPKLEEYFLELKLAA